MTADKKLGIVADDLTGAMDTAGAFAARGLPALVSLSSGALPGAGWDVLCFNTHTRNAPLSEAREQVRSATRSLVQGGYSRLFKKIDSTLRGNVGAEVDAMMDESNAPYAFVVPAFPNTGRTQRDGILYVGDRPLGAAPEGKDRLSAPASSSIVELMEQQTSKPVGLVSLSTVDDGEEGIMSAVGRLVTDGVRMVTVDAVAPTHIVDIMAALTRGFPDGLLVGSAGLAGALAKGMEQYGLEGSKPTTIVTPGPVLVVSGSVNPVSVAQVDRVVRSARIRWVTISASAVLGDEDRSSQEAERVAGEVRDALESGEDACLTWSSDGVGPDERSDAPSSVLGQRLNSFLSGLVGSLGNRLAVSALVLVGGDTAYGVLAGLRAEGVVVEAEIMPGIPMGRVLGGVADGARLITKAGGFGGEDALLRAVNHIRGS